MSSNPSLWVIVPAAGTGRRFAATTPKQYQPLLGKTVLEQTLDRFSRREDVAGIILVVAAEDRHLAGLSLSDKVITLPGGAERSDSVWTALAYLAAVADENSYVAVHDAARPCVRQSLLDRLFAAGVSSEDGVIPALQASDTIKLVDDHRICATLDRQLIYQAQTPQLFRFHLLYRAMLHVRKNGLSVTDDASAVETLGIRPTVIAGDRANLKITVADDLALAAFYLETILQEND